MLKIFHSLTARRHFQLTLVTISEQQQLGEGTTLAHYHKTICFYINNRSGSLKYFQESTSSTKIVPL